MLICKVCLQITENPINMTLALYRGEIRVTEMFKKCTEIELNENEDHILCKECQKRLFDAYEFRCQAKQAENLLKKCNPMTNLKDEKENEDFYWSDTAPEPVVQVTKKEEAFNETKVRKKKKRQLISPTNRFQCRFCLNIIVEGLREHEKQHIRKNILYFFYKKTDKILI